MTPINRLFVYGTLMTGHRNFKECLQGQIENIEEAYVKGYVMYDFENFTGIIAGKPDQIVYGQLATIKSDQLLRVIKKIDLLEEYYPDDIKNSLYLREITQAINTSSQKYPAYIYI